MSNFLITQTGSVDGAVVGGLAAALGGAFFAGLVAALGDAG